MPRQDLIPPLETGLLSPQVHAANGTLFPQPRVMHRGNSVLLDDITGQGLRLMLGAECDATAIATMASVKRSGVRVVQPGAAGYVEEDGIVADWFARHHAIAALVRPDHYVYGVASTPKEIDSLAVSFHIACTA